MNEYYTFDDVLIQPGYSDIESRSRIDLSSEFLGVKLTIPVISANMDYITEHGMAQAMRQNGALGILHRFGSYEHRLGMARSVAGTSNYVGSDQRINDVVAISIGVKEPIKELALINTFEIELNGVDWGKDIVRIMCIDVAHGHHKRVGDLIKQAKQDFPNWKIIAGNVATADGAFFLEKSGADAVKVGIGPGSVCTTRIVTGVGVPQLSAISEVSYAVDIPVIADGGIRNAGDIAKALAAGADVVMLGYLLAGATETPGERLETGDGRILRPYRGQSIFGSNDKIYTREGIAGWVDEKGPVYGILKQLMGGLRSSLSYVGARNLEEFRSRANFIKVSPSTLHENHTRVRETI